MATALLLHLLPVLVILESGRGGEADPRVFTRNGGGGDADRDMVSVSMFKVYDKYNEEPRESETRGNTVRSFRAVQGVSEGKEVFHFNLSSIQDSELVLSASFHFLHERQRQQQTKRTQRRLRRPRHRQPSSSSSSPRLLFRGSAAPLGNVTLAPLEKGAWRSADVTAVVRRARDAREPRVTVELDAGPERLSAADPPYILLYADDRAIDEPNSVALSLQRYGSLPLGAEDASANAAAADDSASRTRRELRLHARTNDIPEVHFTGLKNHELWQNTYFPAKAKAKAPAGDGPQVLSFDDSTMKKARRRQWSEPRVCSRRYLRVDFADIGWSEWVLAPKSFEAYYCAGACGFPIAKVVRPSNHATIQSIVRAVGIVPGVPEPCCVPEKMSPLSVLFLDPQRNLVLKVYPGMSVDTCACR